MSYFAQRGRSFDCSVESDLVPVVLELEAVCSVETELLLLVAVFAFKLGPLLLASALASEPLSAVKKDVILQLWADGELTVCFREVEGFTFKCRRPFTWRL